MTDYAERMWGGAAYILVVLATWCMEDDTIGGDSRIHL